MPWTTEANGAELDDGDEADHPPTAAPSPFVALVLLNLLEVAPRQEHLDLLVVAGQAWLDAYPDFRPFWIDQGVGHRWCAIVESICNQAPAVVDAQLPIRAILDNIVASLVGLSIPKAYMLENSLSKAKGQNL
jgi:hypothetical protein